jgi:hypothetical protein
VRDKRTDEIHLSTDFCWSTAGNAFAGGQNLFAGEIYLRAKSVSSVKFNNENYNFQICEKKF